MRNGIRYFVGTGLVLLILAVVPIATAQTDSNSNSTANSTTTKAADDTPSRDLKERLEHQKTNLRISLSADQTNKLKQRCKPAQNSIGTIHSRLGNSITVRTNAYTRVAEHLAKIIDRLKASDVDVTALQQQATTLDSKIAVYKNDLAAYKQALVDLKSIDCIADPAAFTAALQTARSAHTTLLNDTVAIKDYIASTIRPTLQAIVTQLKAKESSNSGETGAQ